MTTRGRHGPVAESEIARVVDCCAADRSPVGRRDALVVYFAAELGIHLDTLVRLDLRAVTNLTLSVEGSTVPLPEPGARLLDQWLETRGVHSGPLLTSARSGAVRRLTVSALRAILSRRCIMAGVVPFTAVDVLRTRQARLCGTWIRGCCNAPYGLMPSVAEVEPVSIHVLGRMGAERRGRLTKLLTLFAAQMRPPVPVMAVRWGDLTDDEMESAIVRLAGSSTPRQTNAVRRAVLFIRRRAVR